MDESGMARPRVGCDMRAAIWMRPPRSLSVGRSAHALSPKNDILDLKGAVLYPRALLWSPHALVLELTGAVLELKDSVLEPNGAVLEIIRISKMLFWT